jgi:hypothetical protein
VLSTHRLVKWWPAAAVGLGLALTTAYAFRSIVWAADHRLPGLDAPIHYAWEVYTRAALAAGVWPLWNPYAWSGTPHFADALTTTAYPPAVLLRWLPVVEFFRWMVVVHLVIGGTGALYLSRLIGLHWLSGAAAAAAVALGGAAASWTHLGHVNILYAVSWLPWAVGLAIQSVRRATVLPHPALPLVLVTVLLAGHIQFAAYVTGAVSLYFFYSALWPEPGSVSPVRWRPLAQWAVLGLVALGLSAFQLLPQVSFGAESARVLGLPYERAAAGGWEFRDVATIFWPFTGVDQQPVLRYLSHRVAYVGWILACVLPLAFTDSPRRRFVVFFTVLGLGATVMAFGDNTPLFRLQYLVVPGFRIPGRFLFLTTLSLAIVGAIGFERFVTLAAQHRWSVLLRASAVTAAAVALASVIAFQNAASNAVPPSHLWPWLPAAATAGLVLMALLAARGRIRAAMASGLLILAVDVVAFAGGASTVPVEPVATLRQWLGPADEGRVWSLCENRINSSDLMAVGRPAVDGPFGLTLDRYADWLAIVGTSEAPADAVGRFPVRRDLLDMAGVTTIFSCESIDAPGLRMVSNISSRFFAYRNEHAWPRAVWTCDAEKMVRRDAAARLRQGRYSGVGRLERGQRSVNVRWVPGVPDDRRTALESRYGLTEGVRDGGDTWKYTLTDLGGPNVRALVSDPAIADTHGVDRASGGLVAPGSDAEVVIGSVSCGPPVAAQVLTMDRPDGHVRVEVDAPRDGGFVFFSEPYYPERAAFVDDVRVSLAKANLAFSAVPVPAGRHIVELRMVPVTFYAGLGISAATLAAWSAAAAVARTGRRRAAAGVPGAAASSR